MEKTYKRMPFDIELAKKIQSGEVEGRIITADGEPIRILALDIKDTCPIAVAVTRPNGYEVVYTCKSTGEYIEGHSCSAYDLAIELPEETPITFHTDIPKGHAEIHGDTISFVTEEAPKLDDITTREGFYRAFRKHEFKVGEYVQYGEGKHFKEKLKIVKIDDSMLNNIWVEVSTEDGDIKIKCPMSEIKPYEQKHEFKVGDSVLCIGHDDDEVFEIIKIEENQAYLYDGSVHPLDDLILYYRPKQKCKFKPFDKVLVRENNGMYWKPTFYVRTEITENNKTYYETIGSIYHEQCIPYEGNEHLIGTTYNPE